MEIGHEKGPKKSIFEIIDVRYLLNILKHSAMKK